MIQRTRPVYTVLLVVWVLVVAWQAVEHRRVQENAREVLINRSKDISSTVGLVLRSQRRFGVISQDRLESALSALIKEDELTGVAILNTRGDPVASSGTPIDYDMKGLVPTGIHWGADTAAFMNLVDLGTNMTSEAESRPPIVLSREDMPSIPTNRPAGTPAGTRSDDTNAPPRDSDISANRSPADEIPPGQDRGNRRRGRGDGRPQFGRPFWMSEAEYKEAIDKKGIHSFVMLLSTRPMQDVIHQDIWLRVIISVFAGVAVVGFGVAWRNLARTADLEVRLARASELNTRLKEMNLAAAGLAHETRNPLNIIRGLAHIVSRNPEATAEIREKSRTILDEADRVTAQLNEFINYSRPRDVRRTAVKLGAIVAEITRALGTDIEDKDMKLEVPADLPVIEADEQLLRQSLFNLILNAIQACDRCGIIQVVAEKTGVSEIHLDIRDNGPGVIESQRSEIFKPYVTNYPDGTGLGLAIVQQIATAHGWDIRCLPNEPRGAIFRLSRIRLAL